jgi:hypothetical protein
MGGQAVKSCPPRSNVVGVKLMSGLFLGLILFMLVVPPLQPRVVGSCPV